MLSTAENERLTRVGPGTPMGALFRQFWLPVLVPEELPEPNSGPVRVRLLGEDLIAFRDASGRFAFLGEHCPHRGASLYFGRNEQGGLRCVYHGWKFDVTGQCVEMPNEPPESNFKEKVRQLAYPGVEWGGLIWAYLGHSEEVPELPAMEWTLVPDEQRFIAKYRLECNYMQGMEADLDSSHISFLHSTLDPESNVLSNNPLFGQKLFAIAAADTHPHFIVRDTEAGLLIGARRNAGNESYYWRITQWLMPSYSLIPGGADETLTCQVRVPLDDEHHWYFRVRWNADGPLSADEVAEYRRGGSLYEALIPGTFRPQANKENDYLLDREKQRKVNFTGIQSIPAQDIAMMEGMGPIYDRSSEHLGSSDLAVIGTRRRLLNAASDLEAGLAPTAPHKPEIYRVRSAALLLDQDVPFEEGAREALAARK